MSDSVVAPVALVTGCSSGFGMLAALELARRGQRVFAMMRDVGRAGRLEEAAAAEGLDVTVVALDVTDDDSVRNGVGAVLERAGRLDVVVNNAGVASAGAIEAVDDAVVRTLFETNVFGVLRVLRATLPTLRAQGSGAVVNVSSLAGLLPGMPLDGYYYATKHALEALTEALAHEVEPFGIRVALVEPGLFKTAIGDNLVTGADPEVADAYAELTGRRLARRLSDLDAIGGDPQDVAVAIADAVTTDRPRLRWPLGPGSDMVDEVQRLDQEGRAAWVRRRLHG
ncbi:MAG: SDR family oxidoreductase [Actinomycetota bacterium]|nr:SDR family oxidoreductase [Actinomycetota bacterium]